MTARWDTAATCVRPHFIKACARRARAQCPHLGHLDDNPTPCPSEEGRLIWRTDVVPGMEALAATFPPGLEVVFSCYRLYGPAFTRRVQRLRRDWDDATSLGGRAGTARELGAAHDGDGVRYARWRFGPDLASLARGETEATSPCLTLRMSSGAHRTGLSRRAPLIAPEYGGRDLSRAMIVFKTEAAMAADPAGAIPLSPQARGRLGVRGFVLQPPAWSEGSSVPFLFGPVLWASLPASAFGPSSGQILHGARGRGGVR